MNRSLVLSILSDDKPGVVEALARVINDHHGNWLESQLSQLAGKFAGILHVSIPEQQLSGLKSALTDLQKQRGIQVISTEVTEVEDPAPVTMHFTLMGNDRPGIIREISQAFASRGINLNELVTSCTSMPWSGTPMFTARGSLQLPANLDQDDLSDELEAIADLLGVDFELRDVERPVQG